MIMAHPSNSPILVDSSVWIQFFRSQNSPEAKSLDELLSIGKIATCAPIRCEVVSGTMNKQGFHQLRNLFEALIFLEPPENIWIQIEESRFALARQGVQVLLIDLWIALTALYHRVTLWTVDKDFNHIRAVIPFKLYEI